ncbi:MAG: hydrogenase maturation protease [Chloroflexota bacterium]
MTSQHDSPQHTLILGVGNLIMGDEGFGVRVARRLKEIGLPDGVAVEEGGVGGFNLLGLLEGVSRLIVVDIMIADVPPGEVRFFRPGPGLSEPGKSIISFHQVGVLELVQMWGLLGYEPEIFFLVTRPEKVAWSTELSAPVRAAADKAVGLLEGLARDNFSGIERSLSLCTL